MARDTFVYVEETKHGYLLLDRQNLLDFKPFEPLLEFKEKGCSRLSKIGLSEPKLFPYLVKI